MATLKDVANKAGVAVSTASYALNNRREISGETRLKVLRAAEELNYKPSGSTRDLKKSHTKTIGLILSDLSGPFYSELIRSIEEVTFSNGYNLIAFSSYGGSNSTARKFLEEQRTDGIILLSPDIEDSFLVQVAHKDFPIVVLDRLLESDFIWPVSVDNQQGAFSAVEHLARQGYKEMAFISGPVNSRDNELRRQGFMEALSQWGLTFRRQWLFQGCFTQQGGYEAAVSMLAQKQLPEAIFCANDEMAIGVMEALQEAGVKVPDDIAVVGFDDIEISRYVQPRLTTVSQPKRQIGRMAAHVLFRAINGDTDIDSVVLNTEFIVRESSTKR